jgi:hypothetical protein
MKHDDITASILRELLRRLAPSGHRRSIRTIEFRQLDATRQLVRQPSGNHATF